MSPPQQLRQQTSNCSSLLIYRPRKDERLSWPSWLTYSGRLTQYPHKWSPISYKSSAGQQKHAGQRPTLYRWTTQPTQPRQRVAERKRTHLARTGTKPVVSSLMYGTGGNRGGRRKCGNGRCGTEKCGTRQRKDKGNRHARLQKSETENKLRNADPLPEVVCITVEEI